MKSGRKIGSRRGAAPGPEAEQYSLFAATARAPHEDIRHYERQAQLCQRLLSGVHQPDLVEALGRLHAEFEAKAMPEDYRVRADPSASDNPADGVAPGKPISRSNRPARSSNDSSATAADAGDILGRHLLRAAPW